jgi:hypothetical protein
MRHRLWQHLAGTHAIHPDWPQTWPVHAPAHLSISVARAAGGPGSDAHSAEDLERPGHCQPSPSRTPGAILAPEDESSLMPGLAVDKAVLLRRPTTTGGLR